MILFFCKVKCVIIKLKFFKEEKKKRSRMCYHRVDWASERLSDPWNTGAQVRGGLRTWRLETPPGLANKQKEQMCPENLSTKAWCDPALRFLSLFPPMSSAHAQPKLQHLTYLEIPWHTLLFHRSKLCTCCYPYPGRLFTGIWPPAHLASSSLWLHWC